MSQHSVEAIHHKVLDLMQAQVLEQTIRPQKEQQHLVELDQVVVEQQLPRQTVLRVLGRIAVVLVDLVLLQLDINKQLLLLMMLRLKQLEEAYLIIMEK